jgi:hypothetical protein
VAETPISPANATITVCGEKVNDPERFMAGEIEHPLD